MSYGWWAAAALVVTLVVFGFSDLDIVVQNLLYDETTGKWFLDKQEPVARALFYTGPKALIIVFGVCCFLALAFSNWLPWAARRRRALIVVVLSLIVVPSLVGGLKSLTNVACPTNLEEYGGTIPHVRLFDFYPEDLRPAATQRCFPAGHASGAFALFSLIFLFERRRSQVLAAGGAFAAGAILALYKMAIGDHFVSHTLVALELAVLLVSQIAAASYRFVPARIDRP